MSSDPHLSMLALDALAINAVSSVARAEAEAHLASCAACRAQAAAAQHMRAELPPYLRVRTLEAVRRKRTGLGTGLGRIFLLAPLALAVLVVVLRLRGGAPAGDDLAVKGGPVLQVYALRDRQVFEVTDGTMLAAGDEIRFAVTPAGATHVLIASIDGSGHVTIYVPYDGAHSAEVEPEGRSELPGSIVLDDAAGPERVVAVFSMAPIAAADVEAELRKRIAGGPDQLRVALPLAIPAAQAARVFEKAPR
jgi:hypothetical protein